MGGLGGVGGGEGGGSEEPPRSSTARQLWHVTSDMAVIDSLCAISLRDKDEPTRGGAVT